MCKRFNIDNSRREKHNAVIDCELLSRVYINLLDQKEPSLDLRKKDGENENFKNTKIKYFNKIIKPSDDELTSIKII